MKEKHINLFVIFACLTSIIPVGRILAGGLTESGVSNISGDETIYFAQFGNGGGLISEIVLTNPSDSDTIPGRVAFYDNEGHALSVGIVVSEANTATASIQTGSSQNVSSIEFSIAPLGSLTLSTDGTGALTVGSAIITSAEPLGGFIRFSIDGLGIAGVGTSESLDSFIIPVTRKKDGLNTGIALLNVEQTPVSVTLSLNNQSGEQVPSGSTSIEDFSPLGHIAKFISELFPEAYTEEFLGTLTVTVAGGKVAATAVEFGLQPGEFTTLPVTPSENLFGKETVTLEDGTYVCRPPGLGPFPVVLYNHGGLGNSVGGDLKGTCEALAEAGYLARSEKRPETIPLHGHLEDVLAGLSGLLAHPDANGSKVTLMGFSRGGLLTLQAAVEKPNQIHSIVLMAPAPGNNTLQTTLENITPLEASVLIMVAENDVPPAQAENHVQLAEEVDSTLRVAGKTATMILYPPFSTDGHELFFEVRNPYWSNILTFLETENNP